MRLWHLELRNGVARIVQQNYSNRSYRTGQKKLSIFHRAAVAKNGIKNKYINIWTARVRHIYIGQSADFAPLLTNIGHGRLWFGWLLAVGNNMQVEIIVVSFGNRDWRRKGKMVWKSVSGTLYLLVAKTVSKKSPKSAFMITQKEETHREVRICLWKLGFSVSFYIKRGVILWLQGNLVFRVSHWIHWKSQTFMVNRPHASVHYYASIRSLSLQRTFPGRNARRDTRSFPVHPLYRRRSSSPSLPMPQTKNTVSVYVEVYVKERPHYPQYVNWHVDRHCRSTNVDRQMASTFKSTCCLTKPLYIGNLSLSK